MVDIFHGAGQAGRNDIKLADPSGIFASVTVTGVPAVMAVGTVIATGNATIVATGVSGAIAVGTVTISGAAAIAASGVSAVIAVGTVTVTGGASIVATGISAAIAVGTVVASGAANVVASGLSSAIAINTVTVSGAAVVTATGLSTTEAVGSVVATGNAVVVASGNALVGAVGTEGESGAAVEIDSGLSLVSAIHNIDISTTGSAMIVSTIDQSRVMSIGLFAASGASGAASATAGGGGVGGAGSKRSRWRGREGNPLRTADVRQKVAPKPKTISVSASVQVVSSATASPWVVRGVASIFESATTNANLYGWAMRPASASVRQPSLATSNAASEDVEGVAAALGLDAPEVLDLL